jgi:hypothetical protein
LALPELITETKAFSERERRTEHGQMLAAKAVINESPNFPALNHLPGAEHLVVAPGLLGLPSFVALGVLAELFELLAG